MTTLHRYADGICDEKGQIVAVRTKGWWYRPNETGEMEACSAAECKTFDAYPITARKVQLVLIPKPRKKPAPRRQSF